MSGKEYTNESRPAQGSAEKGYRLPHPDAAAVGAGLVTGAAAGAAGLGAASIRAHVKEKRKYPTTSEGRLRAMQERSAAAKKKRDERAARRLARARGGGGGGGMPTTTGLVGKAVEKFFKRT